MPRRDAQTKMHALTPTLSRGVHQHRLEPDDDGLIFPSLTEAEAHTDAFQAVSPTGLVAASEAEQLEVTGGLGTRASSLTALGVDEKGGEMEKGGDEAKLVTWTEDDPENPRNFSILTKWVVTVLATALCFNVGLASSLVTGGLEPMRAAFHVSEEVINLQVCLFVVGFGLGPVFLAPLSESLAASAPMTNAAGSIGDVWSINERGHKMAAFSSILFASPCLGPPIGGYIAEYASWRIIYYVQIGLSGLCLFAVIGLMPETYAPTLLRHRAMKLRKETGDDTIMTEQERRRRPFKDILSEALLRPLVMLGTESIMICFSGYLSLIYGLLYGFFFAYPIVFAQGHGFSYGQTGLTFFGILIGIAIVGSVACPIQENWYQKKVEEGNGSTPPESRLPLMMGCAVVLPIALFIFAWTSQPTTHWIAPCIAGIPFGFSLVGIYISANSYLVDAFSQYGASAMAAKTLVRSLLGATVPMWIDYMYKRLGNEWAGSLMAFISLAMCPIPFAFYWYGARIRASSKMATS